MGDSQPNGNSPTAALRISYLCYDFYLARAPRTGRGRTGLTSNRCRMCADVKDPDDPDGSMPTQHEIQLDRLYEGLATGDLAETASALRDLGTLENAEVTLLADICDGRMNDDRLMRRQFPFRLRFSQWNKGRPKSAISNWQRDHGIVAFVKDWLSKGMPQKNAIKLAAEKFGDGVTTVRKTLKKREATI